MLLKGVSQNGICSSQHCSKTTVSACAAKISEMHITPEPVESMGESDVRGLFVDGRGKRSEEYLEPDYERICRQLATVPHMTLQLQWMRYCDCNPGGKRLYQLSQFCRKVGEYARATDVSSRMEHEPGRCLEVGWAGDRLCVTDRVTGRQRPAWLFVACPPYSCRVYAECFPDMRTRSWLAGHAHAFAAMGGVADILVPDSCATATDGRGKREPIEVNRAYADFADHYGCAVVPARVRAPKD